VQLLAPLSKAAGGHGTCGNVFLNTNDTDYQGLLAGVREAQAHLNTIGRFNMAGFRPEPEYVREMQRYGVLAENLAEDAAVDVYATDRRYWESLWHPQLQEKHE
jgi:hypothetical protein